MTISPFLSAPDATTVALDFGVFIAEQARTHRVSQTAIIAALRPCITPSQPEATSKPHAPAADTPATQAAGDKTDGEVVPPPSTSPSVKPIPETSDAGAHGGLNDAPSAAVESVPLTTDSPANEGDESDVAPENAQRTIEPDAANGGGQRADAVALGSAVETGAPKHLSPKTRLVVQCHADHPDWPVKVIAAHLGLTKGSVSGHAAIAKIKLPSQLEWDKAQKAKTTEALKAPAKPQKAKEPSPAPSVQPAPELPPLSKPSDRLPLPPPIVRPVRREPTGRFYLREKAEIGKPVRYVHQSLSQCPTGPGPLMTLDRKWAWFDTMDRYRGALAKWPQITSMIKEGVAK